MKILNNLMYTHVTFIVNKCSLCIRHLNKTNFKNVIIKSKIIKGTLGKVKQSSQRSKSL